MLFEFQTSSGRLLVTYFEEHLGTTKDPWSQNIILSVVLHTRYKIFVGRISAKELYKINPMFHSHEKIQASISKVPEIRPFLSHFQVRWENDLEFILREEIDALFHEMGLIRQELDIMDKDIRTIKSSLVCVSILVLYLFFHTVT